MCVVDEESNEGRIMQLAKRLQDIDLFDLMSSLDFAADYLVRSVEDKKLRDYQHFKSAVVEVGHSTELIRDVVGLVKSPVMSWFRTSNEADFARARNAYAFLLRLNLKDVAALAGAAYEKWLQSESAPSTAHVSVEREKRVLERWFPLENLALLIEGFLPQHGSGTVYEGVRKNGEKAFLGGLDENLTTFLRVIGWDPTFQSTMAKPWYAVNGILQNVVPGIAHKIINVPKNWKIGRLVSEEPASYMFMELGANNAFKHYLRTYRPELVRHYCIDTEHLNRQAAREGSITGHFATIDISAASDSVSYDLVERMLGETCLGVFVSHLRTQFAEFDLEVPDYWGTLKIKDILRVAKFAPMGSGLCFSIESTIFAAITKCCVQDTPGADPRFWIYGDDIVVDTLVVPNLIARLCELGFEVNTTKSFFNLKATDDTDLFRESCGGEYLNGYDVTPLRISRKFCGFEIYDDKHRLDPHSTAQLVSLANDLYRSPTARYCLVTVLRPRETKILFDSDGSAGLKTSSPTNFHLKKRWNQHYQRWECRAVVLASRVKNQNSWRQLDADYLGEVRLFEYLRLATQSNRKHLLYPEDMVDERVDPFSAELRMVTRWVPLPEQPVTSSDVDAEAG
jgi:hypothetical protein